MDPPSVVYCIVIVITIQDSTSSRLLPGSTCSCHIRNFHALVHKQRHPVNVVTAHEILQQRAKQLCSCAYRRSRLTTAVSGHEEHMGFIAHRKIVQTQSCPSHATILVERYASAFCHECEVPFLSFARQALEQELKTLRQENKEKSKRCFRCDPTGVVLKPVQ
jgi:hypothetical protein